MSKTIIWFRNDLRLADNPALNYAYLNNHEVIFLYISDPKHPIGSASKWFLHHALLSLAADLKEKYQANLIIDIGDSFEILQKYVKLHKINSILWNRVYEPQIIKRDIQIKKFFNDQSIQAKSFNASLFFEPNDIKNNSGEFFKVFTPFWRNCLSKLAKITNPLDIPETIKSIVTLTESKHINDLNLLPRKPNWALGWENIYKISEISAHEIAWDFMQNKMDLYHKNRDFPAKDGTSVLSPYIHYGLISSKQLYFKAMIFDEGEGRSVFLSELGWREFAYYLLYHFPAFPLQNFKAKFNNFPWLNNESEIIKWQKGQTGFPIIDAAMRQLWQTGWMHNRMRMVVASFLTKNLLVDWRIGAKWFNDCLVDADLAANSASWQWVAGSGVDAAPYFRIFNPITQSEKFDKNGDYIRKWVPELKYLTDKQIHMPSDRSNYKNAMIDLKATRNRALEIYRTL
jgi:deoxyribodipyrimidine photo-lyase